MTTEVARSDSWSKSSYSGGEGGECVEVSLGSEAVRVRDSKRIAGPCLVLAPGPWAVFIGTLRGEV